MRIDYSPTFSYFCTMHKFIEYISDLLFLHDCVIIPDFGGFICNYKSAYIDEANGTICPPSKDILFNRNLTHNDGLLVNWIACKESINYEKASKQLSFFCEDLKVRLNQKQRIVFGDIGVFYTDRRFNIIFESGKNNFFPEAYGMEPVVMEKITTDKITPRQIATPDTSVPNVSAYINVESGNILHRLLKYGLAIAGIAGIIVVLQLDIFHSDKGQSNDVNASMNGIITNTTAVQPSIPTPSPVTSGTNYDSVISPDHDYVDYDPINDLAW